MNADALRDTDLRDGIPLPLWAGANQAARDLLLAEHQRQRADAHRQRERENAQRQELLARILARPNPVTEPTARLRALLLETAAAATALAMTLPADDGHPPTLTRRDRRNDEMNAVLREAPRPTRRRMARRPLADLLFRSGVAHVHGFVHDLPPLVAAERLYAGDERQRGYLLHQKAAVDPALTSVPDWAGALAHETMGEFFTVLAPESAFAQLAALGQRLTFASGKVRVPARSTTPTLAGEFIGENQPIPVKRGAVLAASLPPKKMSVLSVMSSEINSAADMETFLRQAITEDTAVALDTLFLDANPATTVRPAGLLNGVTLTPSAGTTPADIAMDLKAAVAPVLLAGGGRRVVVLMNPLQALTLSLTTAWTDASRALAVAGVIVSPNVPVGTLIVVDAADFVAVGDAAPQFEISRHATLHTDTDPDAIVDTAMATPVISLFQQDALAIRMIQQTNWTMRRPGMVAGVNGIQW